MEHEPIALRATIFRDEFPELHAQLKRLLPEHKFRRRSVLIEILRRGCLAAEVSPHAAPELPAEVIPLVEAPAGKKGKKGKKQRKEIA
ncbi:hypothetical protein [Thauera sp. 63]|uniref:hypothetical protein n=1 Tax=Thauera sp. 63 TaxID=497321 RepID=UPI0002CD80A7|nr:hypothetical protein [Thauera sp. 63]ENO79165.1 hypothetical protein C664_05521 [Thauera sp. 63]